jgi:hypothetical protein
VKIPGQLPDYLALERTATSRLFLHFLLENLSAGAVLDLMDANMPFFPLLHFPFDCAPEAGNLLQ